MPGRTSISLRSIGIYDIVERYRSGSPDFDDRGVIYIRHGEPSSRAHLRGAGSRAQRIVALRSARRRSHLPFRGTGGRAGLQSWWRACSTSSASATRSRCKGGLAAAGDAGDPMAEQLLISRERLAPIYGRLQTAGKIATGRYQDRGAAGRTGQHRPRHQERQLRAGVSGRAQGPNPGPRRGTGLRRQPEIQIAYAIAGSGLEPVTVTQGYLYSVRVRFVAIDRMGKVAAALDTTRHFVSPAPVPDGEHLVGRVALKVPHGSPDVSPGAPAG